MAIPPFYLTIVSFKLLLQGCCHSSSDKLLGLYVELHKRYKKKSEQHKILEKDRPALVNISSWFTDFHGLSEKFLLNLEKASGRMKKSFGERKIG